MSRNPVAAWREFQLWECSQFEHHGRSGRAADNSPMPTPVQIQQILAGDAASRLHSAAVIAGQPSFGIRRFRHTQQNSKARSRCRCRPCARSLPADFVDTWFPATRRTNVEAVPVENGFVHLGIGNGRKRFGRRVRFGRYSIESPRQKHAQKIIL